MTTYEIIDAKDFEKYYEGGANECPFCGSDDIEASGSFHEGYQESFRHIRCRKCDKEWLDIYKLDRVEEIVPGPEDQ